MKKDYIKPEATAFLLQPQKPLLDVSKYGSIQGNVETEDLNDFDFQ